ncbi:hypothetical protein MNBD_ALPHA04-1781 [hydrothermal vent metagenome]|uniref:Uncharacterized protein n=1 Tax=hydrothermal vent metagenome TaxID=652676 RepID=A0A3B0RVU3_9ZZZZ
MTGVSSNSNTRISIASDEGGSEIKSILKISEESGDKPGYFTLPRNNRVHTHMKYTTHYALFA